MRLRLSASKGVNGVELAGVGACRSVGRRFTYASWLNSHQNSQRSSLNGSAGTLPGIGADSRSVLRPEVRPVELALLADGGAGRPPEPRKMLPWANALAAPRRRVAAIL